MSFQTCDDANHECVQYFFCRSDKADDYIDDDSKSAQCPYKTQVCCNKKDNIARIKPEHCGVHNKDGIGYQFSNRHDESAFGEFPWMAALMAENAQGNFDYICGATLIDPHVILTAAHCVHSRSAGSLNVRLGEWDTQTTNEILPHSDHEVDEIIIHPNFISSNLYNDVALLVLKSPAELRSHINTICLPPKNHKLDTNTCYATGWGADKFNQKAAYRVNLKKLGMPVVQLSKCQDNLRETKLGPRFRIHSSFMCAGGDAGVDTCIGDGGKLS